MSIPAKIIWFGELGKDFSLGFSFNCELFFDKGSLSKSQKKEIITIREKKDRNLYVCQNSLQCTVNNGKDVIQNLVSHDQTACVKDRLIGELFCEVDDLLEYADGENEGGILFAADMAKSTWFSLT